MLRTLLIAGSLAALSACVEVQQVVDDTARQGSKGVVTEVLATRFPQVPKELITPFTDCIIDNASALELRELARAAVVGVAAPNLYRAEIGVVWRSKASRDFAGEETRLAFCRKVNLDIHNRRDACDLDPARLAA